MFHAKFGVNYTPYRLQCRYQGHGNCHFVRLVLVILKMTGQKGVMFVVLSDDNDHTCSQIKANCHMKEYTKNLHHESYLFKEEAVLLVK